MQTTQNPQITLLLHYHMCVRVCIVRVCVHVCVCVCVCSSGKDAHKFIEGLLAALKGPRTVHLLPSFTAFIPRAERNWFSATVDTHVKRYQQSQQNQHQPNGHTHTSTGIACGSGRQGMGTAQGMRPGQAARPQGPGAGQAGSGQQPMRQMTLQGRPASSGGPGVGTNSHGRMGSGPGMSGGGGGGFGVAITTDGKRILLGPGGSGPGVGASTAAGGVGASHNAAPSGAAAKGRSASAPPAAVLQPRQAATTAAPHPAAARTGLQRTHGAAVVAAAVKREPGMQVEGQVSKRPKSENAGELLLTHTHTHTHMYVSSTQQYGCCAHPWSHLGMVLCVCVCVCVYRRRSVLHVWRVSHGRPLRCAVWPHRLHELLALADSTALQVRQVRQGSQTEEPHTQVLLVIRRAQPVECRALNTHARL